MTGDFGRALPAPRAAPPAPVPYEDSTPAAVFEKTVGRRFDLYQCTSHPKAPPQALLPPLHDADEDFRNRRSATHGGVFEKLGVPPRFGWHGLDAKGRYSVSTPALTGEGLKVWESLEKRFAPDRQLQFVARQFAVVVDDVSQPTQLVAIHKDGNIERLAAASDLLGRGLLLSDGTGIVQFTYPNSQDEPDGYLEVIALDENGQATARRWFAVESAFLALGPSGPGVVVMDGDALKYFSLNPGTAPVVFPMPRSIPNCTGTPKGGTLQFFGVSLIVQMDPPQTGYARADGIVEMREGEACLRGIRTGSPYALTLDANNGAFRGTLVGPKTIHTVTCQHKK